MHTVNGKEEYKIKEEISDEEIKQAMNDTRSIELQLNGSIEPVKAILQKHLIKLRDAPLLSLD